MIIMTQREEKRKPHPSRLRGRGVEVSVIGNVQVTNIGAAD